STTIGSVNVAVIDSVNANVPWRKLGGVYSTPDHVVDIMLAATLGQLLQGKTPDCLRQAPLRILEPACGQGIFLTRAYRYLLDWHRTWYLAHGAPPTVLTLHADGTGHLTPAECQRLLWDSCYGVDVDPHAVRATQQALFNELQRESQACSEACSLSLHDRIKLGNAIIGADFAAPIPSTSPSTPFHWAQEFPEVAATAGFDLVIGNPPYVDSVLMQAYQPEFRAYCNAYYQTAVGNWDLFCLFIERSIALCKPSGLTSLIVPNKLLSAPYAAATRHMLTHACRLILLQDYSRIPIFPVAVYPVVYVAQKLPSAVTTVCYEQMHQTARGTIVCIQQRYLDHSAVSHPRHFWSFHIPSQTSQTIHQLQVTLPTLADLAEVSSAATVAEAYQIQPHIQDLSDPRSLYWQDGNQDGNILHPENASNWLPIINSGTIDPYCHLWGRKPMRYLKTTYLRPVVNLRCLSPRRQCQAIQPKLIIAGLSQVLECAIDPLGQLVAGKSTIIICSAANLFYLLALLNSKFLRDYYRRVFGGDCLRGGYLRVGAAYLRSLPIVPYEPANDRHRLLVSYAQHRWQVSQFAPQDPQPTPQQQYLDWAMNQLVTQLYCPN
ncbi:MAG: Eco57I restriction-modification methylase domain-containing protein, partial [Cyanobacteria bacterium]|nr:Eco57I restriction-modification methylase domain-containing protein [Cyanobacteriota bacterium]MDW8201178.1 TaqI-like C-terminal specificity domain-containing protein [Cyanobacteriota bacterium SKYGB_h_bin112]